MRPEALYARIKRGRVARPVQGAGRKALWDGRPFAFAGLWEHWTGPAGTVVEWCTILTAAPNDLLRPVHYLRMAVIPPGEYDWWLL